jgi:hypothetical protein
LQQNGNPNGNIAQLTLPILNGSHPNDTNLGALKTGYKFKFELMTIGNYFGQKDYIEIIPSFYYVPYSSGKKTAVDLYYNEGNNYFVKVGSKMDADNTKTMKLGDAFRNVPDSEIQETIAIVNKSGYISTDGNPITVDEDAFRSKNVAHMDGYNTMMLPWRLRTFVGNANGLNSNTAPDRIKESVQKWHGEYCLPDEVYVVTKGLDVISQPEARDGLDGEESFWLKDGYIVVNFDMNSVKQGATPKSLNYLGKNLLCSMWIVEGYNFDRKDSSGTSFDLKAGDVIFYYANKRSSGDYVSGGNR